MNKQIPESILHDLWPTSGSNFNMTSVEDAAQNATVNSWYTDLCDFVLWLKNQKTDINKNDMKDLNRLLLFLTTFDSTQNKRTAYTQVQNLAHDIEPHILLRNPRGLLGAVEKKYENSVSFLKIYFQRIINALDRLDENTQHECWQKIHKISILRD